MARRRGSAHMAWVRSFKRKKGGRRRYRRNSWPVGGMVVNPRRRRRSYRANPRRRRGYRRNPAGMAGGMRILGFRLPGVQAVAMTGIGFVGVPMLEGFASRFLPADLMTSTVGRYAVKIASVVGLTYLAQTFVGRKEAGAIAIGGGLYVGISALREFAPGMIPGLASYAPLASYSPMGRPFIGSSLGRALPGAVPVTSSGSVVSARFNRFGGQ